MENNTDIFCLFPIQGVDGYIVIIADGDVRVTSRDTGNSNFISQLEQLPVGSHVPISLRYIQFVSASQIQKIITERELVPYDPEYLGYWLDSTDYVVSGNFGVPKYMEEALLFSVAGVRTIYDYSFHTERFKEAELLVRGVLQRCSEMETWEPSNFIPVIPWSTSLRACSVPKVTGNSRYIPRASATLSSVFSSAMDFKDENYQKLLRVMFDKFVSADAYKQDKMGKYKLLPPMPYMVASVLPRVIDYSYTYFPLTNTGDVARTVYATFYSKVLGVDVPLAALESEDMTKCLPLMVGTEGKESIDTLYTNFKKELVTIARNTATIASFLYGEDSPVGVFRNKDKCSVTVKDIGIYWIFNSDVFSNEVVEEYCEEQKLSVDGGGEDSIEIKMSFSNIGLSRLDVISTGWSDDLQGLYSTIVASSQREGVPTLGDSG